MKPTKCYNVAGYAITDFVQLNYLQDFLLYKSNVLSEKFDPNNRYIKKQKQIKKAMKEGIESQPLLKFFELTRPFSHYPDTIIQIEKGNYHIPTDLIPYGDLSLYQKTEKMPQEFPAFKLTLIKSIKVIEKMSEQELLFRDKVIYISADIVTENQCAEYTFRLSVKKDSYICVDHVIVGTKDRIFDYLFQTAYYCRVLVQQFFNQKIQIALTGNGHLMDYKVLPIITVPKSIK